MPYTTKFWGEKFCSYQVKPPVTEKLFGWPCHVSRNGTFALCMCVSFYGWLKVCEILEYSLPQMFCCVWYIDNGLLTCICLNNVLACQDIPLDCWTHRPLSTKTLCVHTSTVWLAVWTISDWTKLTQYTWLLS